MKPAGRDRTAERGPAKVGWSPNQETRDRAHLSLAVRLALLPPGERAALETPGDLDRAIERAFPGAPPRVPGYAHELPDSCSLEGPDPQRLEGPDPHRLEGPEAAGERFARALARTTRKRGGSYFTPALVARELAHRTLAPLEGSRGALVLDPAAGAGALLRAAGERLPRAELGGADADPDAALLARAVVRHALGREARVLWGDALATDELARALPEGTLAPPAELARAFPPADAVIGNPPFVATYARGAVALGEARRELLARRFPGVGSGEANGFLHFLELALELVAPGGRIGLVLPDTLLVNERYERARRELLARTRDLEARVLDWPVFGSASVRTALVTATRARSTGRGGRVRVSVFESADALEQDRPVSTSPAVGVGELEARPAFAFPRGQTDLGLEARLRERGRALETACWVRDGINPGPRAFRDAVVTSGPRPRGRHVFPCLEGRDVGRFRVGEPRLWVRADPALLTPELKRAGASFRESWFFDQEKLVSRQTAPTLVFAREPRGCRALNSVHATGLLPDAGVSLEAVLAVLNSTPLAWYYARSSGETRRVFPQVHVSALRKLPLPRALWERPDLERELVRLVRALEKSPGDAALDREVDTVVSELFGLGRADRRTTDGIRRPKEAENRGT